MNRLLLILFCMITTSLSAQEIKTLTLFQATELDGIEVKFIANNTEDGSLVVKNLTEKSLNIKLPTSFAAVPILAQQQQGNGGAGGAGGGSQAVGGGFGGGGGGLGGGGGGLGGGAGMGVMRVAPKRTRKISVVTVCLEHGKRNPMSLMKYKIVPLKSFTDNKKAEFICVALGRGQIKQVVAQAAIWNVLGGVSWEELMSKNKVESRFYGNTKWFTPRELEQASFLVSQDGS